MAWILFSDVTEFLKDLSNNTLGIISNGDSQQQRKKLSFLGIENYFSKIIISSEVDFSKPDLGTFEIAYRQAEIQAKNCVYIGDKLEVDAIAAKKAGIRGLWLNRNGKDQTFKDVETVTSLNQFPSLINV